MSSATEPILIDSSSWVEALGADGRAEIRERVAGHLRAGRAAWCDLVAVELWNGARGAPEKRKLAQFDDNLICLETSAAVWKKARELARLCRGAGRTVPASDIVVVACALGHGVALEHCDAHIEEVLKLAAAHRGHAT